MTRQEAEPPRPTYRDRIAILPGDPRIAYRPGVVIIKGEDVPDWLERLADDIVPIFDKPIGGKDGPGQWLKVVGVRDEPAAVDRLVAEGRTSHLDIVWFANGECCGTCPPHPAIAAAIAANPWSANPWSANPWSANPWSANPWSANPWSANPWSANPWSANPEALNLVATGKPPMNSAMPALDRALPLRENGGDPSIKIGVLDSGLAGKVKNPNGTEVQLRPHLLADLDRISGQLDRPTVPIGGFNDQFLDPVAGHGTFIAGIIEQLTPGCTIRVRKVFEPQGDVDASTLASALDALVQAENPNIVSFSFGGSGSAELFAERIRYHNRTRDIVFVGSAGNEGTCVEQYPAALPDVVGVGALGPTGPAPWSNYGPWVDASAPGSDLVSSFFAEFDGALPPINGLDPDEFDQWATWSGTSFAGPVVVAALAREMATTGCKAKEAVERVVRARHLARFPMMGTIVNF